MNLPKRKKNRLNNYNYAQDGIYFITICTRDRKKILCNIVGAGVLDCPKTKLLYHGEIADKYIKQIGDFYYNISIDKYVIMPDHIHLIVTVKNGRSGTPAPTGEKNKNSGITEFVSTFKRYCNNEIGENIWQRSYYDHIIRDRNDYNEIWEYIENNPKKRILTHKTQDA